MKYAQLFKEWRIFSKLMALFITYELSETLEWVFSLDLDNLSSQAVTLALGVLTALCALVRFTYSFATHKSKGDAL